MKTVNTKRRTKINANYFAFEKGKSLRDVFFIRPDGSVIVQMEDYSVIHKSRLKYKVEDIIKE